MFTLNSKRLRIEIAEPGESPNDRFRFDQAGYISDVILDGGMHFGASEPRNLVHPSSGGRGFCNEFRFDVSEEAEIGAWFPKFGVGLIRKEEVGKYLFYKAYKEVHRFPIEIEHDSEKAVFVTQPIPCLGYAIKSTKTITVEENGMIMTIQVENTGEKDIQMQEFCHNFISIDGMAVGSDYRLDMPQIPNLGYERLNNRRGFSGVLRGNGKGITFCEFTAIDSDFAIDGSVIEKTIPFRWKMTHLGAKAYVEGEDYLIPQKVAVWGVDHVLSPEIVHGFTIKPGERHQWKRCWKFDTYE